MSGAEIMLINPRRRRRRSGSRKRRARVTRMARNPRRRRRSRRRMSKLQQMYFGGGRARRNPRRRRSYSRRRVTRFRRNPIDQVGLAPPSYRRRYQRSGISVGSFVSGTLMPAAVGAAGALAIDLMWGYLPIPSVLMTGTFAPLARIAAAVAVGYAVGMVSTKGFGEEAMAGAVTVTLYDLAKSYIQSSMPNVTLGAYVGGIGRGLGYIAPAINAGMGAYVGEYTY
jgi:hypothetical protein